MSSVTFVAQLREDGSLTIPAETVEALGLQPGDEIQLQAETGEAVSQQDYDKILAELFEEAERIKDEPGRPPRSPLKAEIEDIIVEKYRKMGLKI